MAGKVVSVERVTIFFIADDGRLIASHPHRKNKITACSGKDLHLERYDIALARATQKEVPLSGDIARGASHP